MSPVLPLDLDPALTIVLIGKSGVGKSASGNTILERPAFKSELDFEPVTMEISEQRGTVLGKQISVVDTPGVLDNEATTKKIKKYCRDLLQSSRPCLFLVVIRVGRFTEEDQKAVRAAKKVLGPRGVEKSYLLFTGGDKLEGRRVEDFIFKGGEEGMLPKVVIKFAGKYHLFDNEKDDEEQVGELLRKSGHLTPQDQPDSPADDPNARRVVLIGLPGAGKSSSGNTILGSDQFKSGCDFNSVSAETVSGSATVGGRKVTVVDTPGITDPTGNQLYDGIMKTVVEASPGPHAFVFVVRLGRITETDIKLFKLVTQLLSKDTMKYSMVLITHGDELGGRSIDGLIRSNHHVCELVSRCGGRFCVFDNKAKRSREQVRVLLSKIDQMVSGNGGGHYTDEMFKMAHTFLKEAGQSKGIAWERFKRFIVSHKWKFIALAAIVAVAAIAAVGAVLLTGGAAAAAAGVATGVGTEAGIVAAEGIVAAGTAVAAAGTGAGVAAGVTGTAVAAAGTGAGTAVAAAGTGAGVAAVATGAGVAVAAAGTGAGVAAAAAGTAAGVAAAGTGAGVAAAAAGTAAGVAAAAGTGAGVTAAATGAGVAVAAAGTGAGVAAAAAGVAAAAGTGAGVAVAAAGTGAGVAAGVAGAGLAAGVAGTGVAAAAVIGTIKVALQEKKEKVH